MKPICLTCALILLAACAKPVPCPVCYEDAWSREPFPGQPKQHLKPLTPEDVENVNSGRTRTNAPDPVVQDIMGGSSAADIPY